MDFALDSSTRKLVIARLAAKHRSYVCPECKREVHPAVGSYIAPHFRHGHGSFADDCLLYRSGWTVAGKLNDVREKARREQRRPALFAIASLKTWSLELFVPDIEWNYDEVQIKHEIGKTALPRSAVRPCGRRVRVHPRELDYLVEYFQKTRVVESVIVAGLDKNRANVFRQSEAGGRRLSIDEPLVIGDSYTAICDRACSLEPTDGVQLIAVGTLGAWSCYVVQIGAAKLDRLQLWSQRYFSRDVAQAHPVFAVTFPPLGALVPDGTYLVNAHEVIVALQGSSDAWLPNAISFRDATESDSEWLPAPSSIPTTYQLTGLIEERYELTAVDLESKESTTFYFHVGSRPPIGLPLAAALVTKDGQSEHVSPLYSNVAGTEARRVLQRQSVLVGLYLPGGAPVRIVANAVSKPFEPAEGESIMGAPGTSDYEKRVSREFAELLTEETTRLVIDAGDFGRVDVRPVEVPHAAKKARLAPKLRIRLLWLIQSAAVANALRPSQSSGGERVRSFTTEDQSLVDQFIGIAKWPIHLQPLVGAVTRELKRRPKETT